MDDRQDDRSVSDDTGGGKVLPLDATDVLETVEAESGDWETPRQLPPKVEPPPQLDPEIIPEPFREYATGVADGLQVPLGMVAGPMLVAVSCAVGRAAQLRLKPGYKTVSNVWGVVVAPPSSKKSPAIEKAWKPLEDVIRDYKAQWKNQARLQYAERVELEGEIERLKQRIAGEDETGLEEHEKLADLQQRLDELPTQRRFKTSDVTPEKLGDLLSRNPRGLTLKIDELFTWYSSLDKSGREDSRAFFLTCWNGYGTHEIDRVTVENRHVHNPTLSIIGGTQPGKMNRLVEGATGDGVEDDGLLQRFQIIIAPDRLMFGPDHFDCHAFRHASASHESFQRARSIFEALVDLDYSEEDDRDGVFVTELSDSATDRAWSWMEDRERHKRRLIAEGASPAWTSHLGKSESTFASLVLSFHAIHCADGGKHPAKNPAGIEAVEQAIQWCEYLEGHARQVYPPALSAEQRAMYALADRIQDGDIESGMKVRDIARKRWSELTDTDTHSATDLVKAGLEQLEDLGWVKVKSVAPGDKGGRPSPRVFTHRGVADKTDETPDLPF